MQSAAAAAKSLHSCPTLCDPRDSSPQGSPVPGILQARTLEWVAFPSPLHESEKWKLSRVQLFAIPWTAAYQAPPSMVFSRQEYWSRVPLPSPICRIHHEKCWAGRAQAGNKIPGRNINNLRYADDTTLMAGSEEDLRSLLMKVKEKSEKLA